MPRCAAAHPYDGYCSLGDYVHLGYSRPTIVTLSVDDNTALVEHPTSFTQIWKDSGSRARWDVAVYKMNAPEGYTCIGTVAVRHHSTQPNKEHYCCIREDYLVNGNVIQTWNSTGSGARDSVSFWTVVRDSDTHGITGNNFLAVNNLNPPLNAKLLNGQKATKLGKF